MTCAGITVTTSTATGISVIQSNDPLSVYPNPNSGVFYIKGIQQAVEYEVYDAIGKLIEKGSTTGEINLNNSQVGTYELKLKLESGIIHRQKIEVIK
jgi:hypothetical protein